MQTPDALATAGFFYVGEERQYLFEKFTVENDTHKQNE